MPNINYIGYITNDLNSVSKNVSNDIFILNSNFKIYNPRIGEFIIGVPDKFLFFDIVTKILYKVFSSTKCVRIITNNQKYMYGNYVYTYDNLTCFWNSTDIRLLDYFIFTQPIVNRYKFTLTNIEYITSSPTPNVLFISDKDTMNEPTFNADITPIPKNFEVIINNTRFININGDIHVSLQFDIPNLPIFIDVTLTIYVKNFNNTVFYSTSITQNIDTIVSKNSVRFSFPNIFITDLDDLSSYKVGLSLLTKVNFNISNSIFNISNQLN